MTTDTKPYVDQAQVYMGQAWQELDKLDLRQAAEKGWGAASQMVKAVAQRRGWRHGSHAMLIQAIGRLENETRDEELGRCFDAAKTLHQVFYEGETDQYWVALRLRLVAILLDKLRRWT